MWGDLAWGVGCYLLLLWIVDGFEASKMGPDFGDGLG
jgi:hypothetical protein